jgi:Divergent InlB B-repeat domain
MRSLRLTLAILATLLGHVITGCGGSSTPATSTSSPTTYTLSVTSINPASGVAITASPADNSGAANGTTAFTRTYNGGTAVTLTAPAPSFVSWTGCTSTTTTTCTVILTSNTAVVANYAIPAYTLTVNSSNPAGGVSITAAPADKSGATAGSTAFTRTYNAGTSVTLTAPAASGANTFVSWSGCASTTTTACTVTVNANIAVTANYSAPVYTLTVNSSNPASGVSIAAAPADNAGKATGSTSFTLSYNAGSAVTMTAPASTGSTSFSSWTGCTTTSGATCNVTLSAATTVTANYVSTYTLTVNSANPASGASIVASPADNTAKGGGTTGFALNYDAGTAVILSASSAFGASPFVSWTGCASIAGLNCSVTMNANTTVTATYGQPSIQSVTVSPSQALTIGAAVLRRRRR